MNWFDSIIQSLPQLYIPNIRWTDCLEILIIIITLYKMIEGIKNTRVMVILKGIGILFSFYCISYLLNFHAILSLFQAVITLAVFAIIVVFQPELRKFLESMGTKNIPFKNKVKSILKRERIVAKRYTDKTIEELTEACFSLSKTKTGALIVLEKDVPLTEYSETGIYLNAEITKELLINIFEKNTPLHDGAVIAIGDKLVSATAYLPLSDNNRKINKNMGTRHRAAIGISEVTDCQVLVVSEENGHVSYVKGGEIKYGITKEALINYLKKEQNVKNDKKSNMNFLQRCKHNLGFKIISSIFAIIFWVFLMNGVDPIVSRTINDVPITIINEDVVISTGKIYEIVSDSTVNVIVSGKRSDVDKITANDLVVSGDFSKLSYVYAVPLTAYSNTYKNVNCTVANNEIMTIKLNDKIDKEFILEVEEVGKNSEYYINNYEFKEPNIIVSGSKELISIIGKVTTKVDISQIEKSGTVTVLPTIYDKNGSIMTDKMLTTNLKELDLSYKIYPKKEIPIIVSVDNPVVKEISQDVKSIFIAGTENDIKKIDKIEIPILLEENLSNQSSEFSKTILLEELLPEYIYIADKNKEVNITLLFNEVYEKELDFQKTDIELRNLSTKYNVVFEDTKKNIKISGEKDFIDTIKISDLTPYLDLSGLEVGEYNLILQYNNIEGVKIVEPPLIKIKVIKR